MEKVWKSGFELLWILDWGSAQRRPFAKSLAKAFTAASSETSPRFTVTSIALAWGLRPAMNHVPCVDFFFAEHHMMLIMCDINWYNIIRWWFYNIRWWFTMTHHCFGDFGAPTFLQIPSDPACSHSQRPCTWRRWCHDSRGTWRGTWRAGPLLELYLLWTEDRWIWRPLQPRIAPWPEKKIATANGRKMRTKSPSLLEHRHRFNGWLWTSLKVTMIHLNISRNIIDISRKYLENLQYCGSTGNVPNSFPFKLSVGSRQCPKHQCHHWGYASLAPCTSC